MPTVEHSGRARLECIPAGDSRTLIPCEPKGVDVPRAARSSSWQFGAGLRRPLDANEIADTKLFGPGQLPRGAQTVIRIDAPIESFLYWVEETPGQSCGLMPLPPTLLLPGIRCRMMLCWRARPAENSAREGVDKAARRMPADPKEGRAGRVCLTVAEVRSRTWRFA